MAANNNALFEHPDVTNWAIHGSQSWKPPLQMPNLKRCQIAIRMRNFASQADAIKAEHPRSGMMYCMMFKRVAFKVRNPYNGS